MGLLIRAVALAATLIALSARADTGFTLQGRVVNTSGDPVQEAGLWFAQDRRIRRTRTSATGSFAYEGVPAGDFELVAYKEGLAIGGYEGYLIDSTRLTVSLGDADRTGFMIVDDKGQPVDGARIQRLLIGDPLRSDARFYVPADDLARQGFPAFRSDGEGRLVLDALPSGAYIGFMLGHLRYVVKPISYYPVGGQELVIRMKPGVRAGGRVTNEAGEGVPRARVSIFVAGSSTALSEVAEPLSDAEGFYAALVSPGHNYYATARHPDYAPSWPERILDDESTGEGRADLVLPRAHSITGSTIGPEDRPLPGVRIVYEVESAALDEVFTLRDGTFALKVARAPGRLRVRPPRGYMTTAHPVIEFAFEEETALSVPPIRLEPLPVLKGHVRYADGTPAENVLVTLMDGERLRWHVTDASGRFRLALSQMPKEAAIDVEAEHAFRFLRARHTQSLHDRSETELILSPFEPNISPADPTKARNNLEHMVGKPAPEWACGEWLQGKPVTVGDLKGKVIVLTLWGGFQRQGEAQGHLERIKALHQAYGDANDVAFIAVHDAGAELEQARRYVGEYGLTFPVGYDAEPALTFDAYNTTMIPQTVLIDKEGKLRYYEVEGRLVELISSLRREA
jgi:redoxin/carboxypeptidase family protein